MFIPMSIRHKRLLFCSHSISIVLEEPKNTGKIVENLLSPFSYPIFVENIFNYIYQVQEQGILYNVYMQIVRNASLS